MNLYYVRIVPPPNNMAASTSYVVLAKDAEAANSYVLRKTRAVSIKGSTTKVKHGQFLVAEIFLDSEQ